MRLLTAFAALLFSSLMSLSIEAMTLTFTAIPDQNETHLQARFNQVAQYLQQALGIQVQYIPVKSYAAAVTAFRNNQVQLAWFGGLSGVQARRLVVNSQAIAQGYEDQFFKTYFIANKQSGLLNALPSEKVPTQFPPSIKYKSFIFGAKGSTSGRLMPEYYIRQYFGARPGNIFSHVGFSGDHSRTIALVQANAYEVGAVNYKVWLSAVAEGLVDLSEINVIWKTPDYPDYQWTVRGDVEQQFGAGFTAKLQNVLINIKDPKVLAAFPRKAFIPASNDDYIAIKKTAIDIGLIDDK